MNRKNLLSLFALATFIVTLCGCDIKSNINTLDQTNSNIDAIDTETTLNEAEELNTPEKEDESNLGTVYENKKYAFLINIPKNWTFEENSHNFTTLLYTPQDDNIKENVGITVYEPKVQSTFDEFYNDTISNLKGIGENFTEISKEKIEVNGLEGMSIVYKVENDNTIVKALQTFFIKDGKIYVIQYTATENTYDKYISMVKNIITSFTLLN